MPDIVLLLTKVEETAVSGSSVHVLSPNLLSSEAGRICCKGARFSVLADLSEVDLCDVSKLRTSGSQGVSVAAAKVEAVTSVSPMKLEAESVRSKWVKSLG